MYISRIKSLFPYSFPNLIMLWIFIILLPRNIEQLLSIDSSVNFAFIILFSFLIYNYYSVLPKTRDDKAKAIAFNIAVLPIAYINLAFTQMFFSSEPIAPGAMWLYYFPMVGLPVIFIVMWPVSYFFLKDESE